MGYRLLKNTSPEVALSQFVLPYFFAGIHCSARNADSNGLAVCAISLYYGNYIQKKYLVNYLEALILESVQQERIFR
jgi:hypothetical protein